MRELAILAALILLMPSVAAFPTLSDTEPNTPRDRDVGHIVGAGYGNLHFDVVLVRVGGQLMGLVPPGLVAYRAYAYLGMWMDCDGDGHVGDTTTGLLNEDRSIRAPLHLNTPNKNCSEVQAEFTTVGGDGEFRPNQWRADYAQIWADFGWPGDAPDPVAKVTLGGEGFEVPAVEPGVRAGEGSAPLKTSPDLTFDYHPDVKTKIEPMPNAPQFSYCDPDHCPGWWSRQVILLPEDPAMYVGLRMVSYAFAPVSGLSDGGGVMTYGADVCPYIGAGDPPSNGWACDPDLWPAYAPGNEATIRDFDYVATPIEVAAQPDSDHDGLGDTWQQLYYVVDAVSDLDFDCLTNAGEFAWLTIPVDVSDNARDFDGDNLTDAEEVQLWNNPGNDAAQYFAQTPDCAFAPNAAPPVPPAGIAPLDPDALVDTDGDGFANGHDPDSDADGLLDGDEVHGTPFFPQRFTSDPTLLDTDGDGLLDAEEAGPGGYGSDPRTADSDLDGLADAAEAQAWRALGHDPREDLDGDGLPALFDVDSDGDGLADGQESAHHADIANPDTDADGMPDGWEVDHALRPDDATDAAQDAEGDTLVNLDEFRFGADPHAADSDVDTLNDSTEVAMGTQPGAWDTDADGMPDGWEVQHGLNPRDAADASQDPDADVGQTKAGTPYVHDNLHEYETGRPATWNESFQGPWAYGTDPRNPDTDHDGTSDGQEVADGTIASGPASASAADTDEDGLTNAQEIDHNLDPLVADSDHDGLCDGGRGAACRDPSVPTGGRGEILDYHTNAYPGGADSDADGLTDWQEASRAAAFSDVDKDGVNGLCDADSDGDRLLDGADPNPDLNDTDGDTIPDGDEVERGTSPTSRDTDHDGLDDNAELALGTDPTRADSEGDGLADGEEVRIGSDPWQPDTDGDGMPDGWEVAFNLSPRDPADASLDGDGDQLENLGEFDHHTNPTLSDTDRDTIPDGAEILIGLDPAYDDLRMPKDDDDDGLTGVEEYLFGTDPRLPDFDGDRVLDGVEVKERVALPVTVPALPQNVPRLVRFDPSAPSLVSDPTVADTDNDGIDDGRERLEWAAYGAAAIRTDYRPTQVGPRPAFISNLREADADGDGLDDGQEMLVLGTDPRTNDTDRDTYTDFDEARRGSDPRDPASTPTSGVALDPVRDTDGDGLKDWEEIQSTGTDPRDPDTDHDGIDDGNEIRAWAARLNVTRAQTYPYLREPDVDGDGLSDGEEFATGALPRETFAVTDPWNADSDGDGLTDGREASNGFVAQSLASFGQAITRDPRALTPAPAPSALVVPFAAQTLPFGAVVGAWDVVLLPSQGPHAQPRPVGDPQAPGAPAAGCRADPSGADHLDSDGDGIPDGEEVPTSGLARGDPCSADGDSDGIPDSIEERWPEQVDPDGDGRLPALDKDTDGDGIPDEIEDANKDGAHEANEMNAVDQDTDDDGLLDYTEWASRLTSPLDPDSDHDGLPDGLESGLITPESKLESAYGTDQSAFRMCESSAVGYAWTAATQTGGSTSPMDADTDGDGILDGIEDSNGDGVFEWTNAWGWRELNPNEKDSDGDGLLDSEETMISSSAPYCYQIQKLLAQDNLATMMGFESWKPHATNPASPDSDGDGTLDAVDVDPRNSTSVLRITEGLFWALERMDPDIIGSNPFAPDVSGEITVDVGMAHAPLDIPEKEVDAEYPTDLINLLPVGHQVSARDILWQVGSDALCLSLPQSVEEFSTTDPRSIKLTIHLVDIDRSYNDRIVLAGSSDDYVGNLPVVRLPAGNLVVVTRGTSTESDGLSSPHNASIRFVVQSPLDNFFLSRSLAHLGGGVVS